MKRLLIVLVASLFCCVSCGDDDGSDHSGAPGSSPQIADLACDPSSVTAGTGSGAITVDCTVNFEDADMDLETIVVSFRQDCGGGARKEVPKNVVNQAAGRTQGEVVFDFIAETDCPAGNYPYEITAEDGTNRGSNVLTLQFILEEAAL